MSRRTLRLLLILEAVVCFALPAYFLVWGLVTLPVWLAGVGSLDNAINVACIFGGLLGMLGLACALVQATQSETPGMELAVANSLLGLVGLISLWTIMTDRFRGVELNWFLVFVLLPPTICGVHLAVIVFRRIAYHERPSLPRTAHEQTRSAADDGDTAVDSRAGTDASRMGPADRGIADVDRAGRGC
jgi:hypothetical protein